MKKLSSYFLISLLCASNIAASKDIISKNNEPVLKFEENSIVRVTYPTHTLWLSCIYRGAIKFEYSVTYDNGDQKRSSTYYISKKIPLRCQQTSAGSYSSVLKGFDRGHLVPANHFDDNVGWDSLNTMDNILPQHRNMNRGAWYHTELITECYRDSEPIKVIGGVIWDTPVNTAFKSSHSISTPNSYWKVLVRGLSPNQKVIAWIIPNDKNSVFRKLDSFQVSVEDLEKQTGQIIDIDQRLKNSKTNPWTAPIGCERS